MQNTLRRLFFRSLSLVGQTSLDKTRYVTRHFKLRDTSIGYPYISGDVFRAISHHVVDATGTAFYPERVLKGDVVFIKTKFMKKFLKYMFPYIQNPFVLITHNGDEEVPGDYTHLLQDQKIIRWFGTNATLLHDKLVPIPIGNGNFGKDSTFEDALSKAQHHPLPKTNLLYLNFNETTHPERASIKQFFLNQPFCLVEKNTKTYSAYLQELMRAKFTISPRGNGIDCHRVWESLLLGTIPVIKTTPLDPLYQDLPILIVKDWQEVSEKFLQEKHKEMSEKNYHFDKCYVDYWLELIKPYTHRITGPAQLQKASRVKRMPQAGSELRKLFWSKESCVYS